MKRYSPGEQRGSDGQREDMMSRRRSKSKNKVLRTKNIKLEIAN
jgi:hypothetical protein